MALLERHEWPGNVRELEAVVEAAALHAHFERKGAVGCEDIVLGAPGAGAPLAFAARVEAFKCKLVREALQRCAGNQFRAARELGVDRSTLRRIVRRSERPASQVIPLFGVPENSAPRKSKPA
jgi:DNA-binding NtrC family response regulator